MRERVSCEPVERVPVKALEAALKARMGWADSAVSPFAIAARTSNRPNSAASPDKTALLTPAVEVLRLAG